MAYTGSARNRREFSIPRFKGEAIVAPSLVFRYAAPGFPKIWLEIPWCRLKKKPQSYGTFSSLCPSPVIESASSRPFVPPRISAYWGNFGRTLAKMPKAIELS